MVDKVVSLFDRKSKKEDELAKKEEAESEVSFEELMKINQAKKEKLEKERAQANKSVLRSYRIKN